MDGERGGAPRRSDAGHLGGAVRPLRVAPGHLTGDAGDLGAALAVRWAQRAGDRPSSRRAGRERQGQGHTRVSDNSASAAAGTADALVLFGITGDLAFKKLFPALYNLTARGWDLPIIGVASSDWDTERLRARAKE